jgi:hypothetical protein
MSTRFRKPKYWLEREPIRPKDSLRDSLSVITATGSMVEALLVSLPIIASTGLVGMNLGTKNTVVTPIKTTMKNVRSLEPRNLKKFTFLPLLKTAAR